MTTLISAVFENQRGMDVSVTRRCRSPEHLPVWIVTSRTSSNIVSVRQFTSAGAALAFTAEALAGRAHETAPVG